MSMHYRVQVGEGHDGADCVVVVVRVEPAVAVRQTCGLVIRAVAAPSLLVAANDTQ